MSLLDDYLDDDELAAQLKVSKRTLTRYKVPCTPIGASKYYRREAVRQWLAARERSANPRRRGRS